MWWPVHGTQHTFLFILAMTSAQIKTVLWFIIMLRIKATANKSEITLYHIIWIWLYFLLSIIPFIKQIFPSSSKENQFQIITLFPQRLSKQFNVCSKIYYIWSIIYLANLSRLLVCPHFKTGFWDANLLDHLYFISKSKIVELKFEKLQTREDIFT